ncbi:hypothetical protein SCATT_28000 [Streptantibioticus cattleyicolor NRRL 8057 = DSM 46488]|uniref:Uncharacterized protein n=1 Tax=Streptantibioticus cattleyicolor (strain ATCC 35852 / DSM 46488 / JCM 4925 / NBRC 14057 / NRRL 8057) TaxID=1003195 RepID=G8WPI8_STREN|nr:hypothetical protein SCATT_28000 [Streptantibioticus cattleyicolor NRRL 8057 = DSM 46488]
MKEINLPLTRFTQSRLVDFWHGHGDTPSASAVHQLAFERQP